MSAEGSGIERSGREREGVETEGETCGKDKGDVRDGTGMRNHQLSPVRMNGEMEDNGRKDGFPFLKVRHPLQRQGLDPSVLTPVGIIAGSATHELLGLGWLV